MPPYAQLLYFRNQIVSVFGTVPPIKDRPCVFFYLEPKISLLTRWGRLQVVKVHWFLNFVQGARRWINLSDMIKIWGGNTEFFHFKFCHAACWSFKMARELNIKQVGEFSCCFRSYSSSLFTELYFKIYYILHKSRF